MDMTNGEQGGICQVEEAIRFNLQRHNNIYIFTQHVARPTSVSQWYEKPVFCWIRFLPYSIENDTFLFAT